MFFDTNSTSTAWSKAYQIRQILHLNGEINNRESRWPKIGRFSSDFAAMEASADSLKCFCLYSPRSHLPNSCRCSMMAQKSFRFNHWDVNLATPWPRSLLCLGNRSPKNSGRGTPSSFRLGHHRLTCSDTTKPTSRCSKNCNVRFSGKFS